MAKNSITDYDNTAANNTDIQSVDIDEGCAPSGINNAIRELMADLADVNDGTVPLASPDINGGTIDGVTIGGTTAGAGTFTGLTVNGAVDISYGDYQNSGSIKIGADLGQNTSRTDASRKFGAITAAHFDNDEADLGLISIDSSSTSVSALTIGGGSSSFNSASVISFQTSSDGASAGTERMRIDSSGNVGIGTSSPSYAIDTLSSGAIVAQFKRDASGGGSGGIRFGNNDKQFTLYGDNSNGLTIYDDSTERMRIDNSGRVTMPYQPAFSVGGSSNTYITQSPILFDNIELNRNNVYNSSTGVFTAPVSGAYKFDAHIYCRCDTGETAYPRIQKSTNNGALWTNFSYAFLADQASGQVDTTLNINVIMNLNANDLVRVIFGGTGDYYHGNEETRFSGFLIG